MISPVAVEKLAHHDFAEIASRQEALQTIFPLRLDILYHPNFGFFLKRRVFQQPQGFLNSNLELNVRAVYRSSFHEPTYQAQCGVSDQFAGDGILLEGDADAKDDAGRGKVYNRTTAAIVHVQIAITRLQRPRRLNSVTEKANHLIVQL